MILVNLLKKIITIQHQNTKGENMKDNQINLEFDCIIGKLANMEKNLKQLLANRNLVTNGYLMLSIREACKIYNISYKRFAKAIKDGELHTYHINDKNSTLRSSDIENWINSKQAIKIELPLIRSKDYINIDVIDNPSQIKSTKDWKYEKL